MDTLGEKIAFAGVALAICGAVFHQRIIAYLKPDHPLNPPVPVVSLITPKPEPLPLKHIDSSTEPADAVTITTEKRASAYKCRVNGKTVYTDLPCNAVGGAGSALEGGNVTQVDSIKRHDNYVRNQQGEIVGKLEIGANGKPTGRMMLEQQQQPAVATVAAEGNRRANFQRCSELNQQRINAVRNGQRDYADRLDDYMKQLKCMSTS